MTGSYPIHLGALSLTKAADGLIDPKLVLAWLLNALGAPGYLVGLLVPVREAGALLPQLLLARMIERQRVRKYFWVVGSAVQGAAALGMAAAALLLSGAWAGWAIVACLAVLAVARSSCSASYKDVAARTLPKGTRGKVSGSAGTIAASAVFLFALALSFGVLPRTPQVIACAVALAGLLWLLAAGLFAQLAEGAATDGDGADQTLAGVLKPLAEDPAFRTYVGTRALLISTALAPPFLVMLGSVDVGFGNLGLLILSASLASIGSSYVWGAFSDRSSRLTLVAAGAIAAAVFAQAAATGALGLADTGGLVIAGYVFVAQIAYQGARAGRKTHLTDMDSHGRKPVYTALSNSVIGVLLLLGGGLGVLADAASPHVVLAVLAGMSAFGAATALRLPEVQTDDP